MDKVGARLATLHGHLSSSPVEPTEESSRAGLMFAPTSGTASVWEGVSQVCTNMHALRSLHEAARIVYAAIQGFC